MGAGAGGSRAGKVVGAIAALIAIAGVVLLVVGVMQLGDASETRDQAATLRRHRLAAAASTASIESGADSPIDQAETVSASVSEIVDAGDTVIGKSDETSDVLGRAVDLANNGNLGAAHDLYAGEGATSVQGLQAELAKARAALAAAQRAVAELTGPAP